MIDTTTPRPPQTLPEESSARPGFAREARTTLVLAFPLIAGQLGQMLMGVADAVMLGHVGVVPLDVASFAHALISVPFVFGLGLLISVSVRVSNARGADQPAEARHALCHGTWIALVFGLLVLGGMALLIPWLHLFGQSPAVTAATPGFLLPYTASLIPALLSMAWKNHADAMGHPWPAFAIFLGGVALNVGLNWLWIYGHWGFPAMGVVGAGLGTLVARTAIAVAMLWWLLRTPRLRGWVVLRGWFEVTRAGFRRMLSIGMPAALGLLTEVAAFAVGAILAGRISEVSQAAHQVALNCAAVAFMIPLGVAMAMTVRIGALAGSGEGARMHRVLAGGWLFGVGFMALSMLTFLFAGEWLASQFVVEPEVIALARQLLIVAAIFQLFDGLQVVSGGALRGFNDVRVPAWFTFVAYWVIALPLGALLAFKWDFGAVGIWVGLASGLAVAGVVLALRAWRKMGAPAPA